jgi:hypothetical protein
MMQPYDTEISHETLSREAGRDVKQDNGIVGLIREQLVVRGRWLVSVKGFGYRIPRPEECAAIIRRESTKGARVHERKLELMSTLGQNVDDSQLRPDQRADLASAVTAVLDRLPDLRALSRGERLRRDRAIQGLHE